MNSEQEEDLEQLKKRLQSCTKAEKEPGLRLNL